MKENSVKKEKQGNCFNSLLVVLILMNFTYLSKVE